MEERTGKARAGLTLGGKFILIFAAVFLAYTATLGFSLITMNQAHGRYQDLLAHQVEMRSLAFAIQNRLLTASAAEQKFDGQDRPDLVAEVKGYLEEARSLHTRLDGLAESSGAAVAGEDELGGLLARSVELYAVAWKGSGRGAAEPSDAVSAASPAEGGEDPAAGSAPAGSDAVSSASQTLVGLVDGLQPAVDRLIRQVETELSAATRKLERDRLAITRLLIGAGVLVFLGLAAMLVRISRGVLRQVGGEPARIEEIAHRVAAGDLTVFHAAAGGEERAASSSPSAKWWTGCMGWSG